MGFEDSQSEKTRSAEQNMKGKYKTISLDRILNPELSLRSDLSPESVSDLVFSIKEVGIIEPLIVRKNGENYELIAGNRRLVAAEIAGLTEVPCIVVSAKGMNAEILKLHENMARLEINPIDWANHLGALKKQYTLSNAKIAEILGMSEQWVDQHLKILEYPESLAEALEHDRMSFSSARELAAIRDPRKREVYIQHAIRGGITPTLAVKWRKEANREPFVQQQSSAQPEEKPIPEPKPESLPVCLVCGEKIDEKSALTITIHKHCQPA